MHALFDFSLRCTRCDSSVRARTSFFLPQAIFLKNQFAAQSFLSRARAKVRPSGFLTDRPGTIYRGFIKDGNPSAVNIAHATLPSTETDFFMDLSNSLPWGLAALPPSGRKRVGA